MRIVTLASLSLLTLVACHTAPPAAAYVDPTQAEWTSARARLDALRATEPDRAYAARIEVALRELHAGKTFFARGAVAVLPHQAMRMVLLGPGGQTAVDAWVTREQWRIAIPSAHIERRGGVNDEDALGLPVGFFRWWFLNPVGGRLLTGRPRPGGVDLVLRDAGATIALREQRNGARLSWLGARRDGDRTERLAWESRGAFLHPGDHGAYVDEAAGVDVRVAVEALSSEEPDPAAFLDPDAKGMTL